MEEIAFPVKKPAQFRSWAGIVGCFGLPSGVWTDRGRSRSTQEEPRRKKGATNKEALVMLGRLKQAIVRPPLHRVSDHERQRIRAALVSSGLLLA